MKTEILALADFAADYGGKLTVVGMFDTLTCATLPAVYPNCSLAIKLRFGLAEAGAKRLRIIVSDPDGQPLLQPMELPIQVVVPPEATSATVQVVVNLSGLRLATFGEHAIGLELEGRPAATTPLFVRRSG